VRSAQPLIDMTLMRVRAVWTANLTAFLLGAGMYASFVVFPQFAQLPKEHGLWIRRLGGPVRRSTFYPRRSACSSSALQRVGLAARFGSKLALVAGSL